MRLALQADVRAQLGLADLPDYINAVNAAIDFASLAVEDDLRTQLDRASCTDIFLPNHGETLSKFSLRRGFVDPATVTVTYQHRPSDDYRVNITAGCQFDYELGTFWVANYVDGFRGIMSARLTATYQAGFLPDPYDPEQYDPATLPPWLIKTCQLRARLNLVGSPAMEVAGVTSDAKSLMGQYNSLIGRKVRYLPDCILARG